MPRPAGRPPCTALPCLPRERCPELLAPRCRAPCPPPAGGCVLYRHVMRVHSHGDSHACSLGGRAGGRAGRQAGRPRLLVGGLHSEWRGHVQRWCAGSCHLPGQGFIGHLAQLQQYPLDPERTHLPALQPAWPPGCLAMAMGMCSSPLCLRFQRLREGEEGFKLHKLSQRPLRTGRASAEHLQNWHLLKVPQAAWCRRCAATSAREVIRQPQRRGPATVPRRCPIPRCRPGPGQLDSPLHVNRTLLSHTIRMRVGC